MLINGSLKCRLQVCYSALYYTSKLNVPERPERTAGTHEIFVHELMLGAEQNMFYRKVQRPIALALTRSQSVERYKDSCTPHPYSLNHRECHAPRPFLLSYT